MRFLKRLISFIAVVAFIIIIYNVFKPEIKAFFVSRGINVPGVTQNIGVFPTSKTVTDANGNVSVVVSLPSAYADEFSQDQLNELMTRSEGRLVASKNPDGTVTFTVSEEYRDELLGQIGNGFDDSVLSTLVTGNISSISHNSDYSVFTVYCDPSVSEGELLTLTGKLFALGKLYASFAGHDETAVRVDVITSDDGTVSNTYSSDNIAAGLATDAQNWAGDMFDNAMSGIQEGIGALT